MHTTKPTLEGLMCEMQEVPVLQRLVLERYRRESRFLFLKYPSRFLQTHCERLSVRGIFKQ